MHSPENRRLLRRGNTGWEAAGGEQPDRNNVTNPTGIRFGQTDWRACERCCEAQAKTLMGSTPSVAARPQGPLAEDRFKEALQRVDLYYANAYLWAIWLTPPADAHALTNRPPLIQPGSGRDGFDSLDGYRLRNTAGFPCGRLIPNAGSRDFFGNALPVNEPPT